MHVHIPSNVCSKVQCAIGSDICGAGWESSEKSLASPVLPQQRNVSKQWIRTVEGHWVERRSLLGFFRYLQNWVQICAAILNFASCGRWFLCNLRNLLQGKTGKSGACIKWFAATGALIESPVLIVLKPKTAIGPKGIWMLLYNRSRTRQWVSANSLRRVWLQCQLTWGCLQVGVWLRPSVLASFMEYMDTNMSRDVDLTEFRVFWDKFCVVWLVLGPESGSVGHCLHCSDCTKVTGISQLCRSLLGKDTELDANSRQFEPSLTASCVFTVGTLVTLPWMLSSISGGQ